MILIFRAFSFALPLFSLFFEKFKLAIYCSLYLQKLIILNRRGSQIGVVGA
jgi:hypothetical protein